MTTVLETKETDSASQDSFWDNETFSDPELIPGEDLPPDETVLINPPEKVCPGCGEEVVRVPGTKGRLPKYHPDCKPVKDSSISAGGPRPVRVAAKQKLIAEQVEDSLAQIEMKVNRAIVLLAIADPYDALVLRVNLPELLANLRPVLMQYAWARNAAMNTASGVSLVGLIITFLTIALPIMAHHKLIPSRKVAQILINVPLFMHRMQQEMVDEGGDLTTSLIARVHEKAAQERAAQMKQHQAYSESVDASTAR